MYANNGNFSRTLRLFSFLILIVDFFKFTFFQCSILFSLWNHEIPNHYCNGSDWNRPLTTTMYEIAVLVCWKRLVCYLLRWLALCAVLVLLSPTQSKEHEMCFRTPTDWLAVTFGLKMLHLDPSFSFQTGLNPFPHGWRRTNEKQIIVVHAAT